LTTGKQYKQTHNYKGINMSGFVTAVVATGVFAYSTVQQVKSQKEAARATERQFAAEQRKSEVQNVRSIREQVRATRIQQGQMANVGAQTGGMGGSGLAGGMSSLASQQQGNIGYMSDIAEENTAIGEAGLQAAKAQSNAAIWGTVGQAATTVGSFGFKRMG
jgi:hypothetical protein